MALCGLVFILLEFHPTGLVIICVWTKVIKIFVTIYLLNFISIVDCKFLMVISFYGRKCLFDLLFIFLFYKKYVLVDGIVKIYF